MLTLDDLLRSPYASRQFLEVREAGPVNAAPRNEATNNEAPNKETIKPEASEPADGAPSVGSFLAPLVSKGRELASAPAVTKGRDFINEQVHEGAKALHDLIVRRRPKAVLVILSMEDARQLDFPVGHPRLDVLYVGHPLLPRSYYPTACFHRMVFEQKYREAIDLLVELRASELHVQHIAGWSTALISGWDVVGKVGDVGAQATSGRASNTAISSAVDFTATFISNRPPRVPLGLVWYEHEPAWQMIARQRLYEGLQRFALDLRYDDDYGVNSKVVGALSKNRLQLGGQFQEHQMTVWRLSGTFAETGRQDD